MQAAPSAKEFFISYRSADTAWAEWIAWQLESNGYPAIIQAWDFDAGSNFVIEMDRALKEARKVILVLSRAYLESTFTTAEWAATLASDPTGQKGRVIPVRIEPVEMKGLLAPIVYVDMVGKSEAAAKQALLSQVKSARRKPTLAPLFPGNAPSPEFPGAASPPRAQTPEPLPEPAQADITVQWPTGPLYSNTTHAIQVTAPPGLRWMRVQFEYNENLLWVNGPGKMPDGNEFVCEFDRKDTAHTIAWKLGIRSAHEECVEPITAYFFNHDEHLLAESYGQLELAPKSVLPTTVRSVEQTLLWLLFGDPHKRYYTRAFHAATLLTLFVAVLMGYHYYHVPDPITHFKEDLRLIPSRMVVDAAQVTAVDPMQEFPRVNADSIRQAWKHPPAWSIEPGFGENKEDGKLRLAGPGIGTFPRQPEGSALYDFHMSFAVELPPQGTASWIVRAQPRSPAGDPASEPGYHFTLTNRGEFVYLSAAAVKTGGANYNLLPVDARPLLLNAPCCSAQDRIRIQMEVKNYDLNFAFNLQQLKEGGSKEQPPDNVTIRDARHAFRYGLFQILGASPGPAYEFIRLQDAS